MTLDLSGLRYIRRPEGGRRRQPKKTSSAEPEGGGGRDRMEAMTSVEDERHRARGRWRERNRLDLAEDDEEGWWQQRTANWDAAGQKWQQRCGGEDRRVTSRVPPG